MSSVSRQNTSPDPTALSLFKKTSETRKLELASLISAEIRTGSS
ncbi:hypothetical protein HanPSC8_Chr16g0709441 [Helianthus annuus]|nr:hypothetical protein HanPSC8_Chr16g0709441 [Helianthus annuus]